jgi:PAS domain-containing protein
MEHPREIQPRRARAVRRLTDNGEQASQYARSLIEASLDPLVTISADGKITDVNEATINVTAVARDRVHRRRALGANRSGRAGPVGAPDP